MLVWSDQGHSYKGQPVCSDQAFLPSRIEESRRSRPSAHMLAADIPSLHSMLAVDPNGDSEVKGDAEAKGDADVQPRPSLSVTFPDESTVRASNASPLERSVPLVPELLTRNAPIKSVAVANIAARRLTRACSAAKIDLSSVSSRRKSGEDPSSRRKSGEDPEATFQVRLRIACAP